MIYVVSGPTGVGKTKLSIMLAKKLNAIIINADSRQVYQELNIGTAKIKEKEMEGIAHYLLSVRSIDDNFNAYEYQKIGRKILEEYKDKNIVIVGGTGLYIKTLLYEYKFDEECSTSNILYPHIMIGLTREREKLYKSINNRVDEMIKSGLIEEAKALYPKKQTSNVLNATIGYKELFEYFDGIITKEEAIEKIKQNSRHYAKRQFTFFNNQFENVKWYDVDKISYEKIVDSIIVNK